MFKILLFLLTTLLVASAQAEEWFDYEYRGTCLLEKVEDAQPAFVFYSAELKSNVTVDGVGVFEGRTDSEVEHIGAFKANYTMSEDRKSVKVGLKNQVLVMRLDNQLN